ncbi:hypothetical protein RhiirA5_404356 [Rhizophagus irregularis]|uniref:Uncharacterized protein n=1 Tax=Rhizophagus irregularis TaxID=588596 RepID=A0A2N0NQP7_9GLOM|nr:hypothetical protein RhiirA5_404356 [Rhizophagus irregularis]
MFLYSSKKRKRISEYEEVVKYAEEYGNNKAAEHFDIHRSIVGRRVKASFTWNVETNGKSKRVGFGQRAFIPEAEKGYLNAELEISNDDNGNNVDDDGNNVDDDGNNVDDNDVSSDDTSDNCSNDNSIHDSDDSEDVSDRMNN